MRRASPGSVASIMRRRWEDGGRSGGWYATGGAPAAFAPFAVAWGLAFWADDPAWTNPGNGNPVNSWRDGTGGGNAAVQATGSKQPTFLSSVAALNNKGGLSGTVGAATQLVSPYAGHAQPVSFVIIATVGGTGFTLFGSTTCMLNVASGTNIVRVNAGANVNGANASPSATRALANGASTVITTNGATNSGDASTGALGTPVNIFGDAGGSNNATIGFAGIYVGDVTTDPQWNAFKAGVSSYYGLTLS